ncbi:L-threonylcarbamoyladenylate synthase [Desulforamulus hydrothermalis]|uniref:Threonylcarbamoyl-AMP synthase n=1 Tax=Desulforamulus hydrothermalis Lam5 = DSM 18033 TaxID=1121428 RepID=K8DZE7_9FIRM|nr:L-threonylcarbamoyladenylate synthase [Desulforamulus hydrothermalis]CCO08419.1 putative tRNA threonylcarbamoyladenosine biosynthesis protein YwlC [Desulforamulus hydrothermalis Lam5 = DSM 18033]SHH15022.1 translation factor SUA5 [Desulforamulus hydrothermalis Lam5 = DSM 18033]
MQHKDTQVWQLDARCPEPAVIDRAAAIIKAGGLVAFPTETVYGLGANGLDPAAVAGIYRAKGRPSDNPLILHVADRAMAHRLSHRLPPAAALLMETFWPGPLTLVVPRAGEIPRQVTGGLDTVALRMPDHPVALALIKAAGVPVAAPSANRSGRPSPTTARHVWADLQGRVDAILDGGPAGLGVESTVLDLTGPQPLILRPGGVTCEQLARLLPDVALDPAALGEKTASCQAPRSPGMKYIHYAPAAPLILFEGELPRVQQAMQRRAAELLAAGRRVGLLVSEETAAGWPGAAHLLTLGSRRNPARAAALLFARLRRFDRLPVDIILAEGIPGRGLGLAVMNRLRRAASEIVRC